MGTDAWPESKKLEVVKEMIRAADAGEAVGHVLRRANVPNSTAYMWRQRFGTQARRLLAEERGGVDVEDTETQRHDEPEAEEVEEEGEGVEEEGEEVEEEGEVEDDDSEASPLGARAFEALMRELAADVVAGGDVRELALASLHYLVVTDGRATTVERVEYLLRLA